MLLIVDKTTNPYWNLSAEEYLLTKVKEPVFRLWQNENAIIVGRNQNAIAEINTQFVEENNIKVVRRLTGGGAVFHDLGNLNYTFIENKVASENTDQMFQRFTAPVIEALNNIGVKAYLHGRNDLLIDGRKFSGNAICINNNRILQHGTLLFNSSINNLSGALKTRAEKFIGKAVQSNRSRVTNISEHLTVQMDIVQFRDYLKNFISSKADNFTLYEYTKEDIDAIDNLCKEKYSTYEWNFGHSPKYGFEKVVKFTGGIIELSMEVKDGAISKLNIMGDYFFTKPTDEFCARMIGVKHTAKDIQQALEQIDSSEKKACNPLGLQAYFSNILLGEIASIFFN